MDIKEFFETLALAGVTALIAFVYREILLREAILHWWTRIGDRYEKTFFYKPVWGCTKCVAGQLAVWVYLILHFRTYSWIDHVFVTCASIFLADRLSTILNRQG